MRDVALAAARRPPRNGTVIRRSVPDDHIGACAPPSPRAYARLVTPRESERSKQRTSRRRARRARPQVAAHPHEELARAVGSQAFGQLVTSRGAGILPDGRAHPAVEAAIVSARGGGASLDTAVRAGFAPKLGDDLADVRVHTDDTAHALSHSVSARAFATGSDMFFARGEYRPGTADGDRLLAHELSHVVQQRGAPAGDALKVSQPGDALERDADRVADDLVG
jgi:hypothetical protein